MSQNFVDNAPATQLTTAVLTAPTPGTVETWAVASPAGYPQPPFEFGIDLTGNAELCLCTAISGVSANSSNWTVQRGYDLQSTSTHAISAGQIVLVSSAITPRQGNAHLNSSSNLVPDPTFTGAANGTGTWTLSAAFTYGTANGDASVVGTSWDYYGTGAAAGSHYVKSGIISVIPGVTYDLSCFIDATNATVNAPSIRIYDINVATQYAESLSTVGKAGTTPTVTWTCPPSLFAVVVVLHTNNATVGSGQTIAWNTPSLVIGNPVDSLNNPVHPQYLDAANIRHGVMNFPDGSQSHSVSGPKNLATFSIATNNYKAVPASHFGDVAYAGNSVNAANSLHVHGRESIAELQGGLWAPGTLALWGAQGAPPGWMSCQGQDVRTDLAPQLYEQYGYVFGTAIDWYPATPTFGTYVAYDNQNIIDPYNQAKLTVSAPYTRMADPRNYVMYLPPNSNTYMKLPNIGQLPQVPSGVRWIVKVDYGYNWSPRPTAPPAQNIYTAPYVVDSSYPQAYAVDDPAYPNSPVIQVKTPAPSTEKVASGLKWAYDAVMGIPVIIGSGYISPGNLITGPYLVPVLPYGSPLPNGTTLLPSTTPAPVSTTTTVLSESEVKLKFLRMSVTNGYGYIQTSDNWLNLAGAPFINASDPAVDGYYITGDINAQQRNNQIMLVASNVNLVVLNSQNQVVSTTPMTISNLAVFYPAFS